MNKKTNPTQDAVFQRTLKNLLSAKPKPQSEMKIGKKAKPKLNKRRASKSPAKKPGRLLD